MKYSSDSPTTEKPRDRLIECGSAALSDTEILSLLLNAKVKDNLASNLLSHFGSLRGIISADRKRLCEVSGAGPKKYALIQAAAELVRRSLLDSLKKGRLLTSPTKTREYLTLKMRHYEHEVFACLFLDNQHHVLAFEEMFHGTIDSASVHPREVVKRVLYHNAAAIIFVHNHPSGSDEPSISDERITQELKKALDLIDVRVLDHFVVGETVTSFAERELL